MFMQLQSTGKAAQQQEQDAILAQLLQDQLFIQGLFLFLADGNKVFGTIQICFTIHHRRLQFVIIDDQNSIRDRNIHSKYRKIVRNQIRAQRIRFSRRLLFSHLVPVISDLCAKLHL